MGSPQVVGIQREGVGLQPTSLVVHVIGPLDPGTAQDLANYTLLVLGPHGRGRTIRLNSATYHPVSQAVVLVPHRRLNLHHQYELAVNGTPPQGLASPLGISLAGGTTC